MVPAVSVALLWLLFGGSHIALAAVRPRLIGRLGPVGFVALFYLVAAVTFTALVTYYAAHRFDGLPGLAFANWPVARWLLIGVATFGLALAMPALLAYPRLPTALFDQPIAAVYGIERITRHPFFAGTALFAAAHALLASQLVGAVFFTGWVLLSTVGAWHQDHKLRARRGRAYAEYCAVTSAIPFAAVLGGRQRLVWHELPLGAFAVGLGLAAAARYGHDHLFAGGGLGIAAAVIGGGAVAGVNAWRRAERRIAERTSHADGRPDGIIARLVPRLLMLTGVGHTLLGLVLFRAPLGAIVNEGVVSTIRYGQFDRATAFWFLLFGPACILLGQLVGHAITRGDRRTLTLIGWNLLAMGVGGALIMPISGFWILIALAPLILHQARSVGLDSSAGLRQTMA